MKLKWVQNVESQKVFVFLLKSLFKAFDKIYRKFGMNGSERNEAKRQFMLKRPYF